MDTGVGDGRKPNRTLILYVGALIVIVAIVGSVIGISSHHNSNKKTPPKPPAVSISKSAKGNVSVPGVPSTPSSTNSNSSQSSSSTSQTQNQVQSTGQLTNTGPGELVIPFILASTIGYFISQRIFRLKRSHN